jgi:hypothetical protein
MKYIYDISKRELTTTNKETKMTEKINLILAQRGEWALVVTNQGELTIVKAMNLSDPLRWTQSEISESKIFMLWILSIVSQQFPLMWEKIQELKEDLDHLYEIRKRNDAIDEAENV